MQVVGIDFGTTNIRVSTWNTDEPNIAPLPQAIGEGDSKVMPAVIALRRQPDGSVEVVVGEDADSLEDGANQLVLRNLKRCALASDPYVQQRITVWESWWDPNSRCVRAWGQEFAIKYLMSKMLEEALLRVGVESGFEWIAGCPVHSGMEYRAELAQIITELGGVGAGVFDRVVEEPILLLVAAFHLRKLQPGSSYLVYDLGGGSFDCTLAQIEEGQDEEGSHSMVVYGAHGDPALGGSDVDEALKNTLNYDGSMRDLRQVKEALSPSTSALDLTPSIVLTWPQVEQAIKQLLFTFKTTVTLRETYRDAKVVWNRTDPNAPVGEVVRRNPATGVVRFVSQLSWDDMIEDIDGIILCGGPTKSPLFKADLQDRFGKDKVVSVSDLIPQEIDDPELTAISAGACYALDEQYNPLFVNRLPVGIELEDMITGSKVEYKPYTHFGRTLGFRANDFVTPERLTKEANDSRNRRGGATELLSHNLQKAELMWNLKNTRLTTRLMPSG
ncbi:MAG: Hsp70 family protein [Chloroflexota bacterium]|nr:Hsp70 family protein [Chloroflexota bacterium]